MKTNATSPDPAPAHASFRAHMRLELARRCADNPQYSLRAFAGRLGIDHSALSQILRGRRALTAPMIQRLGLRLGLAQDAIAEFIGFESAARATPPQQREVRRLTRDVVSAIADWQHYAILELVRLSDFRPDSRWIARALDLDVDAVNAAVARLARLGLLAMEAPDRWVDRSGDTAASFDDFTQAALQRLSEELRRLSIAAIARAPAEQQERSSTTLAIASARVAEVKRRLARFRRELVDFLEQDQRRDAVFQLEIHLFPLTELGPDDEQRPT